MDNLIVLGLCSAILCLGIEMYTIISLHQDKTVGNKVEKGGAGLRIGKLQRHLTQ